jgi:hypothetical protein
MKRVLLAGLVAMLVGQYIVSPVTARQATDDLKFFKNFFVTGDYYVAGVGLRDRGVGGFSSGSINIPADNPLTPAREGVPRGADMLAAYLYWQVVSRTGPAEGGLGVKFRGYDLTLPDDLTTTGVVDPKPFGKILAFEGIANCANPGGGNGDNGSSRKTYTYRMDVLRFFDVEGPGPFAGKTAIVGSHQVRLPDVGGQGNQTPIALGASLVLVFRDPTQPLNAIVINDDGVTVGNAQRTLNQLITGFYQPSAVPDAKISYIVGSADPAKNDRVSFPGGSVANAFSASAGASWDNRTYPVNFGSSPSSVSQFTTTVTADMGQRDCLTIAATVFKTAVLDSDGDGLLDAWEKADGSAANPALPDPRGGTLPLISRMGAKWDHKDAFIETGYMDTGGLALSYGGETLVAHSHRPLYETLKLAGDTFKNAPVPNPDGATGINVHFDVGTADPGCPSSGPCEYVIGRQDGDDPSLAPPRGGERVDERAVAGEVPGDGIQGCVRAPTDLPWVCQYSDFPGTVGWKTGYRFLRDELTTISPPPPATPTPEDFCGQQVPGAPAGTRFACRFRFDPNRRDMFRYVFFAHALGIPRSPEIYLADGSENPEFHMPVTNTGIADFRGGDVLMTLGAFFDHDNVSPVGTPFQQASTLVHELGHTMARRHNGDTLAPNCTPQYFSSMNYLYQLRGLIGPDGLPRIGLSDSAQPSALLDEYHLSDGGSGVNSTFRMSWYAPIAGPLAGKPGVTAAKRHCDGSLITDAAQYVRIDTGSLTAVDWKSDNDTSDLDFLQDINFNGLADTLGATGDFRLRGSSDWDKLELNQIGSRRSPGGYFFIPGSDEIGIGPLSLGGGKGDLGTGDISEYALGNGKGDLGGGKGDLGGGKGDLGGGKGDLGGGKGDLGVGSLLGNGKGDLGNGKGDLGLGDFGSGDTFGDEGEIDETLASDLTRLPPNQVTAVQITDPQNYVQVSWVAPNVGGIVRYTAYRALIDPDTGQTGAWTKLLTPGQLGTVEVPAGIGQVNRNFSWVDPDSHRLVSGSRYAYQVTATYRVKDADTPNPNDYEELESNGSSPDAVIGFTAAMPAGVPVVNAAPTINHSIEDQNILRNQSTAALAFTVADLESNATIASTSNELGVSAAITATTNEALSGEISFVFGGSGANRTVQVVHSPTGTQVGTVTVQLSVTDTQCPNVPPTPCGLGTATTSATTFTVTVNRYAIEGVANVPPATVSTVLSGGEISLRWHYLEGGTTTVVASPTVVHQVVVVGPPGPTTRTYTTGIQYDSEAQSWGFMLTTMDGEQAFPAGNYTVTIRSTTPPGYSPITFPLVVVQPD